MPEISSVRLKELRNATGAADVGRREKEVVSDYPWAYEDIDAILTHYNRGTTTIHMTDVSGNIAYRSGGPTFDRKFAGQLKGNKAKKSCEEVLSYDQHAEDKCDDLIDTVEEGTEIPWYIQLLYGAGGLFGVWLVFHPGRTLWDRFEQKYLTKGMQRNVVALLSAAMAAGKIFRDINRSPFTPQPETVSRPRPIPARDLSQLGKVVLVGKIFAEVLKKRVELTVGVATGTVFVITPEMTNPYSDPFSQKELHYR